MHHEHTRINIRDNSGVTLYNRIENPGKAHAARGEAPVDASNPRMQHSQKLENPVCSLFNHCSLFVNITLLSMKSCAGILSFRIELPDPRSEMRSGKFLRTHFSDGDFRNPRIGKRSFSRIMCKKWRIPAHDFLNPSITAPFCRIRYKLASKMYAFIAFWMADRFLDWGYWVRIGKNALFGRKIRKISDGHRREFHAFFRTPSSAENSGWNASNRALSDLNLGSIWGLFWNFRTMEAAACPDSGSW